MIENIELIDIDKLTPYKNNARKHEDEDVNAIISSIEEFEFNDPVGVWGKDNIIVEGHGRVMAAKKLGYKQVPCIRLDHLSDEQRRAYALAHNKTAELSSWYADILSVELEGIHDIDMSEFGFEIESAGVEPAEAVEDDDYEEELPEEPKAKRGEIYQLGNHRLMCGDSTSKNDMSALMRDDRADMIFTDPP